MVALICPDVRQPMCPGTAMNIACKQCPPPGPTAKLWKGKRPWLPHSITTQPNIQSPPSRATSVSSSADQPSLSHPPALKNGYWGEGASSACNTARYSNWLGRVKHEGPPAPSPKEWGCGSLDTPCTNQLALGGQKVVGEASILWRTEKGGAPNQSNQLAVERGKEKAMGEASTSWHTEETGAPSANQLTVGGGGSSSMLWLDWIHPRTFRLMFYFWFCENLSKLNKQISKCTK